MKRTKCVKLQQAEAYRFSRQYVALLSEKLLKERSIWLHKKNNYYIIFIPHYHSSRSLQLNWYKLVSFKRRIGVQIPSSPNYRIITGKKKKSLSHFTPNKKKRSFLRVFAKNVSTVNDLIETKILHEEIIQYLRNSYTENIAF